MKFLSFGHIPSWAGGRQESGLANVIYQLAKNMSYCKDVQMAMAATDVFTSLIHDDELTIYGWTKGLLIKYALKHPMLSFRWLLTVLEAKRKFAPIVSVPGYFFKGLHLARTIGIVKPDAVHLHGMTACVYDKIVPPGVKIVVTMHGIIGNDQTIPNQKSLYKMEREVCLSKRYSFIGFIAEKLISDFKDIYGCINTPCKAIPNAYDSRSFYFIEHKPQPKLILVTVASLSENKGQCRVLEAIGEKCLDVRYICIGAGSEEQKQINESIAKKFGIDYIYVGKKRPDEIRTLLADADYMILPSSTEGFGLVYLEALACGVPVILPKHLPIVQEKDIIQPSVNSILLEDSSVEAIANVLSTLQGQQFNRQEIAESVSGYSWEGIAQKYVESINRVIYE